MRSSSLALLLGAFAVITLSQAKAQDSSALLKAVEIIDLRDPFSQVSNQYRVDSVTLALYSGRRLDEALPIAGLTVNNYGPSLATLTHRGFTSSQVSVRWQGLEMNNAALGLTDLSLRFLPPSTKISFQSAISTSNFGGSGIGGALDQRHDWRGSKHAEIGFQASNLANYTGQLYLANTLGNRKPLYFYLGYQAAKNENRFSYFPNVGRRTKQLTLEHAQHLQHSVQAGFLSNISTKSSLEFHVDALSSRREIPPTVGAFSDAKQSDNQARAGLAYMLQARNHIRQTFRVGYNLESILYESLRTNISDTMLLQALQVQSVTSFYINQNWQAEVEAGTWISQLLKSGGVEKEIGQVRTHGFGSLRYQKPNSRLSVNASYRIDYLPGSGALQLPKLALASKVFSKLRWNVYAALTGRFPTLNDRFWRPGGNSSLQPEKGRAAGFAANWQVNQRLSIGLETEWNSLKNRIVWLPEPQEIWWSAQQQPSFQSLTESVTLGYESKFKGVRVKAVATGSYSQFSFSEALPNQKPLYAPQIAAGGSLAAITKKLLVQASANYIGKRYTATDASDSLPGFYLLNVHASYPIVTFKKWQIQGQVGVNNLLNRAFESVENRPMPLRHFNAKITFQTKNEHE